MDDLSMVGKDVVDAAHKMVEGGLGKVREPDDQVFLIGPVPPEVLTGMAGWAGRRQVVQAVIGMVASPQNRHAWPSRARARDTCSPAGLAASSRQLAALAVSPRGSRRI